MDPKASSQAKGGSLPTSAPSNTMTTQTVSRSEDYSRFGLMGLQDVIKMSDKTVNSLSLGSDLTAFGLNLSSSEPLYLSWTSPFSDSSSFFRPFSLPQCYAPKKIYHLQYFKYPLDTLFFIFFNYIRDGCQVHAAKELYSRGWKYNGVNKAWIHATSSNMWDINNWCEVRVDLNSVDVGGLLNVDDLNQMLDLK